MSEHPVLVQPDLYNDIRHVHKDTFSYNTAVGVHVLAAQDHNNQTRLSSNIRALNGPKNNCGRGSEPNKLFFWVDVTSLNMEHL
jgi:hypothetical protein